MEEKKFLIINTESLWKEPVIKEQKKELAGETAETVTDSVIITSLGISLDKSETYSYSNKWSTGTTIPGCITRDSAGVIYILDPSKKNIFIFDITGGYSGWLWGTGMNPAVFVKPSCFAVSDTSVYVIELSAQKFYCLNRITAQILWERDIPGGVPGSDEDIYRLAYLYSNALLVLNCKEKKVYLMDSAGGIPMGHVSQLSLFSMDAESNRNPYQLRKPSDIASDREDDFYILEGTEHKFILKFSKEGRLLETIPIPFKQDTQFLSLAAESSDNILLGFDNSAVVGFKEAGETYGIIQLNKSVKYETYGYYFTGILNSGIPNCRWHSIELERGIPANTRIVITYAASNKKEDLTGQAFLNSLALCASILNPVDALLVKAEGRYIRFKIELICDETAATSPLVESMKIVFPRDSYLRYLPATYRENEKSRDFLERFLSIEELENEQLKENEIKVMENITITPEGISLDGLDKVNGYFLTRILNSGLPNCRWYNIELERDIPANTRIVISYVASNKKEELTGQTFLNSLARCKPILNPVAALMFNTNGQYIRFKIELIRNNAAAESPVFISLKIVFPTERNRDFLERFLSLFETFMSKSEQQILEFSRFLEPSAVPDEFIQWLSSLLAIAFDENWPSDKKRRLIQMAPSLYLKRGTRQAISDIIQLFYGKSPIIIENFQFDCIKDSDILKVIDKLFGLDPFRFTVLIEPDWVDPGSPVKKAVEVTPSMQTTLQRIVDSEKPAHTVSSVHILEPWFYLDMHTYLGINTVLTEPTFVLGQSSVIGRDTVIYDTDDAGQIGRNSRIGIGFKLV